MCAFRKTLGRHLTDLGVVASRLRRFVPHSPIPLLYRPLRKASLSRPLFWHKPPDWNVRGGTRGHGLDHPRQRREYGKKTARIGASGADKSKAQTPGLDRPGLHPVPRTGTSGDATHRDWNVRGQSGPGIECPGQQTRRRRRRRRDTERRTRTGARNGWGRTRMREDAKREEKEKKVKQPNIWSPDGNNRASNATNQDQPGAGRHRRLSRESGRGSVRKEQWRRQEPKRSA